MDRIHHLIKIMGLKDFIDSQADGLDTKVGEKGIKFQVDNFKELALHEHYILFLMY